MSPKPPITMIVRPDDEAEASRLEDALAALFLERAKQAVEEASKPQPARGDRSPAA